MTAADALLVLMFAGLTAYALFGGADFGAGFWDLIGGRGATGPAQRHLIEETIGPVWEANHVWLIFAIVVVWTAFPPVFAAVASTLYIPLTLVAFGIILRGSGFAFRKAIQGQSGEALFGRLFGVSSILTPFFLGAIAGAVASGRVPPGNAVGDVIGSWVNPTSALAGTLAVGICTYLAAVYLTADARRHGHQDVEAVFRMRALLTGVVVGVIAVAGIGVLAVDAPDLAGGLAGRALPLVVFVGGRRRGLAGTALGATIPARANHGGDRGRCRPVGVGRGAVSGAAGRVSDGRRGRRQSDDTRLPSGRTGHRRGPGHPLACAAVCAVPAIRSC